MRAVRCLNCGNEAAPERLETSFELLGGFMNQPVVKCRDCTAVLMKRGTFKKRWNLLDLETSKLVEKWLATARACFGPGLRGAS